MIIFNNSSSDFVLISADVNLKIVTILKELRIVQLCTKSGQTLAMRSISIGCFHRGVFNLGAMGALAPAILKNKLLAPAISVHLSAVIKNCG